MLAGAHLMQVVTVLLIGAGKDYVNYEDSAYQTALLGACEEGHVAVARLLLEKGAKLEIPTRLYYDSSSSTHRRVVQDKPWSALAAASGGGHLELVSELGGAGGAGRCIQWSTLVSTQTTLPSLFGECDRCVEMARFGNVTGVCGWHGWDR